MFKMYGQLTTSKKLLWVVTMVWVTTVYLMFALRIKFPEIDFVMVYTPVNTAFMGSVVAYLAKAGFENTKKYNDADGNSMEYKGN